MKLKFVVLLCVLLCGFCSPAAEDLRPKFDKTPYRGTVWSQVNPWWFPSKLREETYGGPNYPRIPHPKEREWASAMEESTRYGLTGWQFELNVPAIGYAWEMKRVLKQAAEIKSKVKLAIFLTVSTKDTDLAIKRTIEMFNIFKDELKNHPNIYRLNGAPVISCYIIYNRTPEEWKRLIDEVEKVHGKFIWLANVWEGPLVRNPNDAPTVLRKYMPVFDGVTQYGNWSEEWQRRLFNAMTPVMKKEFPQKIFEACAQNAYSNHFHFGGVATKLSEKWRNSLDIALDAAPDSVVMTNFFDHYENSMILPCYEREDFLLRYAQWKIRKWQKIPFSTSAKPELVVTNYVSILLGRQNLDFEVIAFPVAAQAKKLSFSLDICNSAGKVLHTFPEKTADLSDLSVHSFSVPSTMFAEERGVVPRLRYRWNGHDFAMNYGPMTVIDPSLRSYLMFWARSTRNAIGINAQKVPWNISGATAGETKLLVPFTAATFTADLKPIHGNAARYRIMRNGLQYVSRETFHFCGTRAFNLPSPAYALNWYSMELENKDGNRYETLPVWTSSNTRPGKVKLPVLTEDRKTIRTFDLEAARVPFFYYPCDSDNGSIVLDVSGYMHNGRLGGAKNYGGGHLGYTGYYHYHSGTSNLMTKSCFHCDSDGVGMLRLTGDTSVMIMGGTAFPGASTYEILIRPSKLGGEMGVFGTANNQLNLSVLPDGTLKLWRGGEIEGEGGAKGGVKTTRTILSKSKVKIGEWTRIAVTYDLTKLTLYVNGGEEGEAMLLPTIGHDFINHLTVGSLCGWVHTPTRFFSGDIRQIRIYGRALTPEEFLK